jgi:hypothetical protein
MDPFRKAYTCLLGLTNIDPKVNQNELLLGTQLGNQQQRAKTFQNSKHAFTVNKQA